MLPIGDTTHSQMLKGYKTKHHPTRGPKPAGVTIFFSGIADLKLKLVKTDKNDHHIVIKGTIQ